MAFVSAIYSNEGSYDKRKQDSNVAADASDEKKIEVQVIRPEP